MLPFATLRSAWDRLVLGAGSRSDRAPESPDDVLRFWFGRPPSSSFGVIDGLWLPTRIPCWGGHWASRVLDVDAIVTRHFGALHARATTGDLDDWIASPSARLALIILLDQLSRNIYRNSPQAFANDSTVLPIVEAGLAAREDQLFNPLARTLLYLPLMHHEDLALIDRCVELYEQARMGARGLPRIVISAELTSARRHREIVARFGRYPHRNRILGRESTPEERRFLQEPFSTF